MCWTRNAAWRVTPCPYAHDTYTHHYHHHHDDTNRSFSKVERLVGDSKFACDECCSYQEAEKRSAANIGACSSAWLAEQRRCPGASFLCCARCHRTCSTTSCTRLGRGGAFVCVLKPAWHSASIVARASRMRIKKLPNVLSIQLKRFTYVERLQRLTKLSHRVVFPFELRLFNTVRPQRHACACAC